MSIKVILFDFDGTLADTFDAIVRITNDLAGEFGYKPTTLEDIAILRNLSSREIVKKSGVSIFKIPFILKRVKNRLHNNIQQINSISGIRETLWELKNNGRILGILTSNSEDNVSFFLKKHNMQEFFSFIYSESTLFSKHRVIRKFLNQNNLKPEEVIYVGDETRDVEACKKISIKVIAVSWGFNSREALARHNPDFLIDAPSELLEVVSRL